PLERINGNGDARKTGAAIEALPVDVATREILSRDGACGNRGIARIAKLRQHRVVVAGRGKTMVQMASADRRAEANIRQSVRARRGDLFAIAAREFRQGLGMSRRENEQIFCLLRSGWRGLCDGGRLFQNQVDVRAARTEGTHRSEP